ncbi:MAG: GxxExxY protein [Candidatus Doudnabacteria bacterium]|jgi:GxxExxY protein
MAVGILKRKREDLVYYDECYRIIGVVMDVYNQLGYGYEEKTYQKAVAMALKTAGFKFTEQLYAPVVFEGRVIDKNFFDFLIENIIVLEIKRGDHFSTAHIKQVNEYLAVKKLKLGILVYFAPRGIHYKRIVNLN